MKICPLCGSAMQEEEQFCASCGNAQKESDIAAKMALHAAAAPVSAANMPDPAMQPVAATPAPAFAPPAPPQPQAAPVSEQATPARPMYGGQAAYGQAPQPNAYAQQNTYASHMQGAATPPMQHGQMYQPAPMHGYAQNETVTLGEWMINYLIMVIPVANLVMLCVWAFGDSAKPSVRNWAKASLIWMGIGFVLAVACMVFVGVLMSSMMSSLGYYGY